MTVDNVLAGTNSDCGGLLMRKFAKKADFSVKDQTPKLWIQQKKDVDSYFGDMPDSDKWWVKVDILKGRN